MSEKYNKIYTKNALKSNKYGGRRFLGITPNGREVWTTMEFDRRSKLLELNLGIGFKDLYHEETVGLGFMDSGLLPQIKILLL